MKEHLKVLFLPRWYPNRYDPMAGLFIERHARSVSAHARIAVLYIHKGDRLMITGKETVWLRDDELLQLKIYFRPSRMPVRGLRLMIDLCRYFSYHFKGFKMLRKDFGKPDIIHVNVLTRLGMIAQIYKWISATPYVITEHWTRYLPQMDNYKGFLRKIVTELVVRNASAVMPVTENLRQAMEYRGLKNKNWHIIPNVVDMNMFNIKENISGNVRKRIIHVSCFKDEQKNLSGIIRVLKRLSEKRTDWVCQIVGDGPDFEMLIRYARELKLEGSFVFFLGVKENYELSGMMACADFNVMFSRFENLPVVILESFACGVPVLSTDVGGINEHINDERGILIPSEDEDKLLEKILFMLDHHQEYNKTEIREYAKSHFSREVIGARLFEVYSAVTRISK